MSQCTFSNIRDLSTECIQDVQGIPSDSSSPSDVWIISLKPNTVIKEGDKNINIDNVFLKYFIEPECWLYYKNGLKLPDNQENQIIYNNLLGLRYETLVYSKIITKIINESQSVHFIRSFSKDNTFCSYYDLIDILEETSADINPQSNLQRNINFIFYKEASRPSITDNVQIQFEVPTPIADNIEFGYVLNQAIDRSNTFYFNEILKKEITFNDFYIILFQIVQACYTMYKNKLIHNDLHLKNIWITKRDDVPLNLHYNIDGQNFYFNGIHIMSRIFDFDRSYCETLGKNPSLESPRRSKAGQENKLVRGKDLVKILCNINPDLTLEFFTNDVDYWKQQIKTYQECMITNFDESKLFDYPIIIQNLYSKIQNTGDKKLQYSSYTI